MTRANQENNRKQRTSRTLTKMPGRHVGELVAGTYFVIGVLWILISDTLVLNKFAHLERTYPIEVTKGITFVVLSSLLVYGLTSMLTRRLRRQAEELNAVFSTPELGAIRFDHHGRIESYTPCLPELLGYSASDLDRMSLQELVYTEDWPTEEGLLERFRRGEVEQATQIVRFQRKNGHPLWIEQNVRVFTEDARASFVSSIQAIDKRVQADLKLSERAERLQTAQKIAKLGDWTYDHKSDTLTWSREMYSILERDPSLGPIPFEELLQKNLEGDDGKRLKKCVESAAIEGKPYDVELRLILDNGNRKSVRAVGVPYQHIDGQWKLRGIVQDLSELSALRELLELHQAQLQTVVANLPGVIFQYKRNPDGSDAMTYASEGTEILWGISREEAMHDTGVIWEQIRPTDLESVKASIRKSAQNLQPWHCQWRSKHPDGRICWHEGSGIPKREEDGTIIWNSIILDISDRISTESKLERHQEYWELLSRHASDGIIVCDAEGQLVFFNDTVTNWVGEMDPGLKPHEWSGTYGLYTLDGSRMLREDEVDLVRALKGEIVRNYRYTLRGKDRKFRYIESNGAPLFDSKKKKIGAMIISRNITDRYRREFEMTNAVIEAAEKERIRFASELHDTVTQELSIVSLNLNNLLIENPDISDSTRFTRAQEHLDQAIDQTRSLSHRIMPVTVRDLGLVGAINELVEEIQESVPLEISLECPAETRLPDALELDLFRIVQESLTNVLKHAKADKVIIQLLFVKARIDLQLTDNGIGFEESDPRSDHLGIGLRTIHNRAIKWGGSFRINSDRNKTTVHVSIPMPEAS